MHRVSYQARSGRVAAVTRCKVIITLIIRMLSSASVTASRPTVMQNTERNDELVIKHHSFSNTRTWCQIRNKCEGFWVPETVTTY